MNRSVVGRVVVGAVVGYIVAYTVTQPTIQRVESELERVEAQVTDLAQVASASQAATERLTDLSVEQVTEIITLKETVATKVAAAAQLETERASLSTSLTELERDLAGSRAEVTSQKTELSAVQNHLNSILGISVIQYYSWNHEGAVFYWDLPIQMSTFVEYWDRPRPRSVASYVDMTKDPGDDYIDALVEHLIELAAQKNYHDTQTLNFVVSFVQSLPYTVDSVTTLADEYPRYPIETLFDRGGDCEDTSILVAALLDRMGYDVALLHLKDAQHMAVGVAVPRVSGSYYEHAGKKYYYLETTGEGWMIGDMPLVITERSALVYPVGK